MIEVYCLLRDLAMKSLFWSPYMNILDTNSNMCLKKAKSLLTIFVLLLLSAVLLSGCGSSKITVDILECYDAAGNLLKNCEEEIIDQGSHARIVDKYQGKVVKGMWVNKGYEEWDNAGRPDSGVKYTYYYVYNTSGDRHVLLYVNNSTVCWSISIQDRNGEYISSVYMDADGHFPQKNPVSGESLSREDLDKFESNELYYLDQISELMTSLDYDYLAKIDPASSILKKDFDNQEDAVMQDDAPENSSQLKIPDSAIGWAEASQHVGETVSIYGSVAGSTYASTSNGQPTYIDIGVAYPDINRVSIVVWGEDRGNFSPSPEDMCLGKTICVTGEVYIYNDACNIKVVSPSQIQIME